MPKPARIRKTVRVDRKGKTVNDWNWPCMLVLLVLLTPPTALGAFLFGVIAR